MKKVICALLAVVLCCILSGCQVLRTIQKQIDSRNTQTATAAPVTLWPTDSLPTPAPGQTPTKVPTPTPTPTPTLDPGVSTSELIDYFLFVACNAEYGSRDMIIKWKVENIRIKVLGEPAEGDVAYVLECAQSLSAIAGVPKIVLTDGDADIEITFTNAAGLAKLPGYPERCDGFCNVSFYLMGGEIISGNIGIRNDIDQPSRRHTILEEMTQCLGLLNDSWSYADSIFYQGISSVDTLSALDKKVVAMLYDKRLPAGISSDQAKAILKQLMG